MTSSASPTGLSATRCTARGSARRTAALPRSPAASPRLPRPRHGDQPGAREQVEQRSQLGLSADELVER
jgi:hypothetical protein